MEDSVPIQLEDIDELEELDSPLSAEDIDELEDGPTDCLVCLLPCTTTSQDLFLYNCTCIYYIHTDCFRTWRERSHTNRICLICREELEPVEEEEPEQQDEPVPVFRIRQRPIIFRNPGMEDRFHEDVRTCSKKINSCCYNVCFFIAATLMIASIMSLLRRAAW